jgi:hypothetical protein
MLVLRNFNCPQGNCGHTWQAYSESGEKQKCYDCNSMTMGETYWRTNRRGNWYAILENGFKYKNSDGSRWSTQGKHDHYFNSITHDMFHHNRNQGYYTTGNYFVNTNPWMRASDCEESDSERSDSEDSDSERSDSEDSNSEGSDSEDSNSEGSDSDDSMY